MNTGFTNEPPGRRLRAPFVAIPPGCRVVGLALREPGKAFGPGGNQCYHLRTHHEPPARPETACRLIP